MSVFVSVCSCSSVCFNIQESENGLLRKCRGIGERTKKRNSPIYIANKRKEMCTTDEATFSILLPSLRRTLTPIASPIILPPQSATPFIFQLVGTPWITTGLSSSLPPLLLFHNRSCTPHTGANVEDRQQPLTPLNPLM